MRRFVLPLALGFLCVPTLSQAQPVVPTPAPTISPETTQQMADRILKETSKLRQLSIKRSVPTNVQNRAQIEKFMASQIQDKAKVSEIAAANLYLRQLGLAPKNFDLKTAYARLLGEQVAGYYSSKTGQFTTASSVNPLELETVMSHELTHALQDQHFGLKKLENAPRHESDTSLAFSALVEGDATYTMARYSTSSPLRAFGILASSLSTLMGGGSEMVELKQSPKILQSMLGFPYLSGLTFATSLYNRGGWASISKAYSRPPQSTQQILHFDKYLANKAPVKLPVPDVTKVLGSGWKLIDHDVNGEYGLSLVLGEYVDATQANDAVTAWAGDRYAVYGGPKGAILVVQDTLWDNAAGATAWSTMYGQRNKARFGTRAKKRQEGALTVWNASPDGVWIKQSGRRVVVVEGTVGAFDIKKIMKVLHS
ncbi:hypothetical protein EON83_04440 [bacterium]|nr:MAG: hypothetical protein EON83_04440 [bacterium]